MRSIKYASRTSLQLAFALVCLLFLAPRARSLEPQATQPSAKAKSYKITVTDKLRIAIVQEAELDSIARVDAKGVVNLKFVGEVKILGLTVSEAEKVIEESYRTGRFLRNPQVTINVEEYALREVSIQGEVRTPARYPMPVETIFTVLDLVTRAGGFTDVAKGSEVKITRFAPDGTVLKVFVIDVESLIKGRGKGSRVEDTTVELEPGDIVFVPQRII